MGYFLPADNVFLLPVSAAVSLEINLLKQLVRPLAVLSWCKNTRPRSSNLRNHSSHDIFCRERSAPPGKSMRSTPASPFLPVPRTQDGDPLRSSAHRRISSWSVVATAVARLLRPTEDLLEEDLLEDRSDALFFWAMEFFLDLNNARILPKAKMLRPLVSIPYYRNHESL